MDRDQAEMLALQVLGWVLKDQDIAQVFLGSTGFDPSHLRNRAQDPEFLAAVLEFTLMDDDWVLAAAAHAETAPQELARARRALPGGAEPDWL